MVEGKYTVKEIVIQDKATLSGEIGGDIVYYQFSKASGDYGNGLVGNQITTLTNSLSTSRAGSIVYMSIEYDQTTTFYPPWITIAVDGVGVWTENLTNSVAAKKIESFSQARGTDTFVAGAVITARFLNNKKGVSFDDKTLIMGIQYDAV